MIVLLAILLVVGIYNFVDFGTSSAAAPATSTQVAQSAKKPGGTAQIVDNTLDPRLHIPELAASQNVKYEAGGRNIFKMEELPITKPTTSVRTEMIGPPNLPTPTPTPPPPPIPLKFYGFASKPTEP